MAFIPLLRAEVKRSSGGRLVHRKVERFHDPPRFAHWEQMGDFA
jgi:hypothetical protein